MSVTEPSTAAGSPPPGDGMAFGGDFSQTLQGTDVTAPPSPSRHRRRWVIAGVVVLALVAAGVVAATRRGGGTNTNSLDNTYPTSIATVKQQSLSSQTSVSATLGYAGSYSVVNQLQGTVTSLPAVGQVVTQGQTLYDVDAAPVVLLYGTTPAYRTLSVGLTGADVEQLNADLVALGDATSSQVSPTSTTFSDATETAVKKLQAALGVTQSGSLTLGQAVFLPGAVRVTTVPATLGSSSAPGMSVIQGTSTTRQVTIALDAGQQSAIKVGDPVTITLPDNTTVAGTVTSVGTVATTPSGGGGPGGGGSPTITVDVTPTNPAATGTFDQAPVNVAITTATVDNVLVVPINALLALASGGYAVEVVDASGTGAHRLVPVNVGLFDDAQGLVQVQRSGLAAGQQIVVPGS
ncbi:MAG: efflux RND transporter periplasmic adaptor subunit [Acidimicrobiales bacterium]